MASTFPTRVRWVRYCCFVAVTISSAAIWWRAPRGNVNETSNATHADLDEEEADLASTLVNAREIQPVLTSPSSWNPEPRWNSALSTSKIEYLPRQNPSRSTDVIEPIPESFPLQPRVKKEPPSAGDAIVNGFVDVERRQAFAQSSPPITPFVAKPVVTLAPNGSIVTDQRDGFDSNAVPRPPYWPDQSYASNGPQDANGFPRERSKPVELPTPNLLTGVTIQPPGKSATLTPAPAPENANGFSVQPNQPSKSNYILQPMRRNP